VSYLFTVGDIRRALANYSDDMPVSFYVDKDAEDRQQKGFPVLVNVAEIKPNGTERREWEELLAEGIKDEWANRGMDLPEQYLLFMVG
jgi:hypothetical protein